MSFSVRRAMLVGAAVVAVSAAVVVPTALATDGYGYGNDSGKNGGSAPTALGLVGLDLVAFTTADAGSVTTVGTVSGLDGDADLVGIDFRVQDGKLYGVGDEGGLYTIDEGSAAATKVGELTVDLDGEFFGVDFNPAANALRIISDTGQNLRQPFAMMPLAATVEDTELTNPATPPATGTVPAEGVSAAAYTNNDTDASTSTTLFDLDTALDRVSLQSPANAGTLAPTGNLPADIGPDAGFDIFSTLTDGATTDNVAFATVEVDGERRLWEVDVLTGDAQDRGVLGKPVTDIALKLQR